MKPLIVINLKTYQQGKSALKLAKIINKVDKNIIIGVQANDIYEIKKITKLKLYSQHVDYMMPGRNTGFILPESIKADGAIGTFLNHSEHRISFDIIKKTVTRCKKLNLKTIVFAKDIKEAKKIEKLKPDYIVLEPPELIAGKTSVSEAKPDLIKNISAALNPKTKFLVGAGIHSNNDLKIAMKFGASGIALSSAITTAKNPEKALRQLLG
ncbi:MAG: triose-phosphate isomerase [Candidatus Pacearchaeota archaeon]|jgi:triosephosphate isomerase